MEKRAGKGYRSVYSMLTAVIFLSVVFGVFALNLFEAYSNRKDSDDYGLRDAVSDLESVDMIVYPFVNLNGAFQNVMQRNYIYDADPANDTVKKSDGYIVGNSDSFSEKDVKKAAEQLSETSEWLASMGIPLVYVQAPSKMTGSPEPAMPGLENHTYAKHELFREEALSRGVDYLEGAELLSYKGDEAFYITDHHWTTEACLEVSDAVCAYLRDRHGLSVNEEAMGKDAYEHVTNRKAFLGAEGRRTGRWYAGLDDFTVISPKLDTDFDIEISDKDGAVSERHGPFTEAVMDMSKDTKNYSFEDSAYYAYWGGDYGLIHVKNNKAAGKSRVLVIKDSYGVPVTAFMTNAFAEMYIADIRYYAAEKSLREIVEESRPDAVVYIYGNGYLTKSKMFAVK